MSDKCKRCGACKECGAVKPQPYSVYPYPWYPRAGGYQPYRVYPNTYPGWQSQSGRTFNAQSNTSPPQAACS